MSVGPEESPLLQSLLPEFVRRLRGLSEADWATLAREVPELEGDSAAALLARGRRVANGLPTFLPAMVRAGLGTLHAMRSEFAGPVPAAWRRAVASEPAGAPEVFEAAEELQRLLAPRRQTHPGVVAAIEGIYGHLMVPTVINDPEVLKRYTFLERTIPYASLRAERADGAAEGPRPA